MEKAEETFLALKFTMLIHRWCEISVRHFGLSTLGKVSKGNWKTFGFHFSYHWYSPIIRCTRTVITELFNKAGYEFDLRCLMSGKRSKTFYLEDCNNRVYYFHPFINIRICYIKKLGVLTKVARNCASCFGPRAVRQYYYFAYWNFVLILAWVSIITKKNRFACVAFGLQLIINLI